MTATNGDRVLRVREALEQWAARTAPAVAGISDPEAIRRILRAGLEQTLAELGLNDRDDAPPP